MVKIFHFCGDKSLSHGFLFETLKTYYNITAKEEDLVKSKNGKLYLKDNPVYFSISHSKDEIVIAVANSEIGVDAEIIKDNYPNRQIFGVVPKSAKEFYSLFTKAESIVKYKASSILLDLKKIDLSGVPEYCGEKIGANVVTFTDGNLVISYTNAEKEYAYIKC